MLIKILILCLLYSQPLLAAKSCKMDPILKQSLSKTSIINTKQIKIPGYPNACNPSFIPYKDGYLLSFRFKSGVPETVKKCLRHDFSFIGIVKLDKKFHPLEDTIQLLNVVSYSSQFSLTAEDARLINAGDRIFIVFNDIPPSQKAGQFAMYFGELVEQQGTFALKEPAKLLNYPNAVPIEKNWSPFFSQDRLYLIYYDQPRVILEVELNTGHCHEVTRTVANEIWNWGEIRGGTPAYLIDDRFLTFFHSFLNVQEGRNYIMGAYTFDKDPPFAIHSMTPTPLGDPTYYDDNPSKVVFPAGMVIQDRFILIAWGKADKQIFITTFDKKKLLASMKPL